MNTATLTAQLATLATLSLADLADLNDWAVNTVREYCAERGYDARALMLEEVRRIDSEGLDFEAYLRARRIGSHFCLTRVTRRAVFTALVTRRACAGRR